MLQNIIDDRVKLVTISNFHLIIAISANPRVCQYLNYEKRTSHCGVFRDNDASRRASDGGVGGMLMAV